MRFGLALPHYDFSLPDKRLSWESIAGWARRAEALGYDSVWVSDHLVFDLERYGGSAEPVAAAECLTTLGALAAVTERIRLGSLVLCNDLRPPSLVAKSAATLAVLSGGRLEVGMGAGWYRGDYDAASISLDPPAVRISRLAEAVQVVRGMLAEDAFTFEGKHYRVSEAYNLPRPKTPPSVWVGGKGDRMVRLAGTHADGYNAVWAWTPEEYAGRVEILERAAGAAGRDPKTVRRSVGLYCLPGEDDAALGRRWKRYLEVTAANVSESLEEWGRNKLVGNPGALGERIERFGDLGVEEVILGFGLVPFQIADPDAVEWFAENVIGRTRSAP